ncbi:deleted in autism protein 1 homolog [Copidosoma floridanum]|uniref:deleted in autism protein 1 homolog n=1 Tax=Copidosoma floridanum TaxID=29053 RepID=UPI0006C96F0C|nr:deleted in autism protein 1 homolog [Copidosoma floridanum]
MSFMKLIKRRTIFLFLTTLVVLVVGVLLRKLNRTVADITEREKCPACFGVSLCQDIDDNKIVFEYSDFNSIFNNLFGVKNVYYGKYGDTKVVVKKLAHDFEFQLFDDFICSNDQFDELCFRKNKRSNAITNFYRSILRDLEDARFDDPHVKLRICPTVGRANKLLGKIGDSAKNANYYKYLWSFIKINPEPIFLQLLRPENDWPTPKYIGECGRVVVEENAGLPLSAFINEPWIKRAEISSSLLDAAYKLTFKHSEFAFYLTDVSTDNIAVNQNNQAVFIDLENVIVVDKDPPKEVWSNILSWNETHISETHTNCQDCFIFSPSDICNHKISDHNYMAICQHALGQNNERFTQGFLHSTPSEILKKYSTLTNLIKKCSTPDPPHSRITFGIQLQKVLDSIIKYQKQR